MTTNDFTCNLVSLGKTGVGKSALLNYLFDLKFESGVGKPVTGYGLHEEDAEVKGQKFHIFDSWGIEADKVDQWKRLIDSELRKHGSDKAPEEWFHAVLYCVQAGGARLEDIDKQIILKFINDSYHVVIVLTKIDQLLKNKEENKKKEIDFKQDIEREIINGIDKDKVDINDLKLEIISVCSEDVETRSYTAQKSGRDELIKTIINGWSQTMANRFAPVITEKLKNLIRRFFVIKIAELKETNVSGFAVKNDKLLDDLKLEIEEFCKNLIQQTLPREVEKLLKSFNKVGISLSNAFDATPIFKHSLNKFDNFYTQICSEDAKKQIFNWLTLGIRILINGKEIKKRIEELYTACDYQLRQNIDSEIFPKLQKQLKEALNK